MSSILDALSKIEAAQRAQETGVPPPAPEPRRRRATNPLVLAGAAFVGGVAITAGVLWHRASPSTTPASPRAAVDSPKAALPVSIPPPPSTPARALEVVPPVPAPVLEERPAARVEAAVAPTPPIPVRVPTPVVTAPPPQAPATLPPPTVPPPAVEPPVANAPPPPPDAAPPATRPASGASPPRVRVSFLAYSRAPERRAVSLAMEDGTLVTLHEGEQARGIGVVRILPDRVDLQQGAITFTVQPRD